MKNNLLDDVFPYTIACHTLINPSLVPVDPFQGKHWRDRSLDAIRQKIVLSGPRDFRHGVSGSFAFESYRGTFFHFHATVRRNVVYPRRHWNKNWWLRGQRPLTLFITFRVNWHWDYTGYNSFGVPSILWRVYNFFL